MINRIRVFRPLYKWFLFYNDLKNFKAQSERHSGDFQIKKLYPCVDDRFEECGTAKGHYFHQDLLVAQTIFLNNPDKHIDVGSRIDGFVAHVASFRKITVLDVRPITSSIANVDFVQMDILQPVDPCYFNSCDSLSCLHALEHFGLGRYGDPVAYDGHVTAIANMHKILKHNGMLYLSVPIGPQRIEFNAHRVFSVAHLLDLLKDKFKLLSFSYVDDDGDLHQDAALDEMAIKCNFNCQYGCGILELSKIC